MSPQEYKSQSNKMKSSAGSKFKLLLWKNWLLQKRQKRQTFFEIVLSVLFCILLVVIRDLAPSDLFPNPTYYAPFSINKLPDTLLEEDSFSFGQYLFNNPFGSNDEESRKKRSIMQIEDVISVNNLKNLTAIQEFLQKYPSKSGFINELASQLQHEAQKKLKSYTYKLHKRRRHKRQGFFNFFDGLFGDIKWPIAFSPNNTAVKRLMAHVGDYLDIDASDEFAFATEQQMEKHLTTFSLDEFDNQSIFHGLEDVLGGIVFTNDFPNGEFPDEIFYKIRLKGTPRAGKKRIALEPPPRWNTEITYPVFQVPGPRQKDKNEGGSPGYYDEGFLALQHAIDKAIAVYKNGTPIESFASLKMQRMPYPPYIDDKYLIGLQAWLPLVLLLSYLYPAINIVKSVVYEKEKKLKESMKMMGLDNWLHWTAWFTKSLILFTITSILVTTLLCVSWNGEMAVLNHSDPTCVFFFLFVYSCTSICFCFFLSVLFSRANSAATAAGLLWMFSYIPNIYLRPRFLMISTEVKISLSIYFNTAMSLGSFLTSMLEGTGAGLQWNLLSSGVSPDSPFSMGHVLGMMVFDMVIYLVLTWYIEGVFPGEFGVPKKFYFPFQISYWCPKRYPRWNYERPPRDAHRFEDEPLHLRPGITMASLSKTFGSKKAVREVYLKMFEEQITVLLGHNGAGKTTTMSMLTGLLPPTKGSAYINGFDVVNEIEFVRESIGICPQHDVLFDDMTVEEHILFFSELKGLTTDEAKLEAKKWLPAVTLEDKRHALARTLSGGMKRKLSVAVALCGGSKVVILDEPTTGMDPGARRVIWDLLQRERKGRTMLLTTHFMEEADLLGDRIAIMVAGVIKCYGSSLFLKNLYGDGYRLTFVQQKPGNADVLQDFVQKHIPLTRLDTVAAAEVTFSLPASNTGKFEALFMDLENHRSALGISSYGVSQTTLEEVFLNATDEDSRSAPLNGATEQVGPLPNRRINVEETSLLDEQIEDIPLNNQTSEPTLPMSINRRSSVVANTGFLLYCQQFYGLLMKKMIHTFRNILLTLALNLVPVLFLITAMVILRLMPGVNDSPPSLYVSMETFGGTVTPLSVNISGQSEFQNLSQLMDSFGAQDELLLLNQSLDLEQVLLEQAKKDLPAFNLHWLSAFKFMDNFDPSILDVTAFFNNRPYHIPPISLNIIDQALVRASTNNMDLRIHTYNHPLPRTDTDKLTQEARQNVGFNIGFNLAFGLSFLSASFIMFLIRERESNCKHLQFVSGVNVFLFWAANAIWDTIVFSVSVVLIVLCIHYYEEEGLSEAPQLARIFGVLLLYCWAMLPLMYIFSFFFEVPSTGYIRTGLVNMFIGMASLITVTILRIPDLQLMETADVLDWFFMVLPPYAMASAISELYSNARFTKICNRNIIKLACGFDVFVNPCCEDNCGRFGCVDWTENVLGWERLGIGRMIFFLVIEGFIFYIILAILETKFLKSIKTFFLNLYGKLILERSSESFDLTTIPQDEDVRDEMLRIKNTSFDTLLDTDKVIIKELRKVYHTGTVAVDSLSLGVPLGECFGLLGVNGAGKTSTFKMLTGNLSITGGNAYINGYNVKHQIKKVQQVIGYCPQFDATLDDLTGNEMLHLIARLRGIPEKSIMHSISHVLNKLRFFRSKDRISTYSGGEKRKLSTAIALVGNPSIVFLDEPSSGMDPGARRALWNTVNLARESGKSIILTSHSMEECEALCTRLAIMINGKFRCLGSPQHLKSKFSEGYTLTIRVPMKFNQTREALESGEMPEEMLDVHKFVAQNFNEVLLREQQLGRLEYFIPVTSSTWAQVFGMMERHKSSINIENYSVTQTTLERVFLNFTKDQVW